MAALQDGLRGRQGLGMSLLGSLGKVLVFVGKFFRAGARERPEAVLRAPREVCDLTICDQRAMQTFDSVRVDGPLYVCDHHASDIRRWAA